MCCEEQTLKRGSDSLEVKAARRPFDLSATAWLLGQAVRYLNTADKAGAFEYTRAVDILRSCSRDLTETVRGIFGQVEGGDTTLRWSLLYVLGDAGDESAAEFLMSAALKPLPERQEGEGCQGERDMEMLVSTEAVHALYQVATRHPQVAEQILKVIADQPARPILIEAVKVAGELGLKEKAQHLLPEEDRWIVDIRRIRPQEFYADPEREDGKEREFTPPKSGALYTAPMVGRCCVGKES
jgi:hypothetical protein